jgi:hypothetical protein
MQHGIKVGNSYSNSEEVQRNKTEAIKMPLKLWPVLSPLCDLSVQVASEEERKMGLIEFDFFCWLFDDAFNIETQCRRMVE